MSETQTADAAATTEATETAQVTEATSAASETPWYSSFSEETRGWLENRGLHTKSQADALTDLIQQNRNLEKMRGAPADRIVTLPEHLDEPGALDALFTRLGKPAEAKDYGLTVAEDKSDADYVTWAQQFAHELNLTKAQAKDFDTKMRAYVADAETKATEAQETTNAANMETLKQEWGNTFHTNVELAKNAARKLGAGDAEIEALEAALGSNTAVLKLFQKIGAGMSEAPFVAGHTSGPGGATTPEAARAKIQELHGDPEFRAAYVKEMDSGTPGPKTKQLRDLHILANGGAA